MFSAVPIVYRITFIVLIAGALCFCVVRERVRHKADLLTQQAAICVKEGRFGEAERLYKRALRRYRRLGDDVGKRRTLNALSAFKELNPQSSQLPPTSVRPACDKL